MFWYFWLFHAVFIFLPRPESAKASSHQVLGIVGKLTISLSHCFTNWKVHPLMAFILRQKIVMKPPD